MFPSKLAIEIAERVQLRDATEDSQAAHYKVHDALCDFQKMAAAGMDLEECTSVFKAWMLTERQTRSKKSADEIIKLKPHHVNGLKAIYDTTLPQLTGQIIGSLANIIDSSSDDRQKVEATKVLNEMITGVAPGDFGKTKGSAQKVAELVVGLYSEDKDDKRAS